MPDEDLYADLMVLLGVDKSDTVLPVLIRQAERNVVSKRYPFGSTDQEAETARKKYENVIFKAVIYAYNKQGAEGQASHSENGISRTYIDEESLYEDIVPMAKGL